MWKVNICPISRQYLILFSLYREGAPRHSLLSALGRLHLQLGDVAGAEVCFTEARELRNGPPDVRELVDKGLIAVAQNSFNDAYEYFQQASAIEPSNVMVRKKILNQFQNVKL